MLTDFDATTLERADYCDAADETTPPQQVSEADIQTWEADPWF